LFPFNRETGRRQDCRPPEWNVDMATSTPHGSTGAGTASATSLVAAEPASADKPLRHAVFVRITHWLSVLAFLALLVSGSEIILSHPRFYWGETGNVNMQPLFKIPVPSSRGMVPTGYGYVLPDQNGWSRSLHFESAWLLVMVGLVYLGIGLARGHFRRNVVPTRSQLSRQSLISEIADRVRFKRPGEDEADSYNVLQRLSYVAVLFIAFPLIIWTGLALSPAFGSAFPHAVTLLGGRQSARTLHFFLTIFLTLFLFVHVFMVILAGFWRRVWAMISGRPPRAKESA
jgi:thiosulfate reductase cytochrome b subunit